MFDDLYSARILTLAAHLPRSGRLAAPKGASFGSAERVSKLCGSRAVVDVLLQDGRVVDYAQEVKACALGQAVASIVGEHVIGASVEELESARDQLHDMLKSNGPAPVGRFADLGLLAPVKDYPPRHASTLVAIEAAAEAARRAASSDSGRTSTADAA
jgi:NifU-like protein involved in Fe-S cluster formation